VTERRPGRPPRSEARVVPIERLTREATFRRLADLARHRDPVPGEVVDAVTALAGQLPPWRSVDDELAALVYDSELDLQSVAGVRAGRGSRRRLRFEAPELALEVEVSPSRPRQLVCQVMPPQPAALEVLTADGRLPEEIDDLGSFHVPRLAPGPVSLRCRPLAERGGPVATSWWWL
jgi:hypothetical protein